jgi:hypothetical protein
MAATDREVRVVAKCLADGLTFCDCLYDVCPLKVLIIFLCLRDASRPCICAAAVNSTVIGRVRKLLAAML